MHVRMQTHAQAREGGGPGFLVELFRDLAEPLVVELVVPNLLLLSLLMMMMMVMTTTTMMMMMMMMMMLLLVLVLLVSWLRSEN